jgi:hypothetical protein
VVSDAGDGFGGEQIARRGLEESHHRAVLEGRRVRHIDHHGRADQRVSESFAGEAVDPGVG